MNITFKYDIKDIDNCNWLPIKFEIENGLKHFDCIFVPRDTNGDIDEQALTVEIDNLYRKVLLKKDVISWN